MDARNRALDRSSSHQRAAYRTRRAHRPLVEDLEGRALLATLAPIAPVTVPAGLGFQVPLEGGAGGPQTFSVTSSNPQIQASVARGNFLTVDVTHTSSGPNDPSFAGSLTFQLFEDLTPLTVERIERLVEQGFYTGKNFHRIAANFPGPNDFIVQGGSVSGTGTGEVNQPGYPFADEFVQQLAFTGTGQLAMANAGDDTNSSQFFITTGSPRFLDFQHTIFGQLVSGQPTLQAMTQVARNGETPINPILISSATLSPQNPDGVLHIDATGAPPGATSTITVTATDPADGSTVTRTFQVTAAPNPNIERPFLQPVQNQVVGLASTGPDVQGQTAVFQLHGVDPNVPPQGLTFIVRGGVTGGAFTNVQNATASVDENGIVTVTPDANFTGVINLVVGVGGPDADTTDPADFDTQQITLTVSDGPAINLPPIAVPTTEPVVTGTPNTVQLTGLTANPESDQTLTFEIVTPPANGTVSGFDPLTGTFTYTPNAGFLGTDTLMFRVRDQGAPGPSLTSEPAVLTLEVGGGATGAVRIVGNVLVVTPPPSTTSVPNTITINQANGNLRVVVNGLLDRQQPAVADIDRIVVYGSKKDDLVTIGPEVTLPALLDGGRGGANTLTAGGGPIRGHAWYGRNTITGSPLKDFIAGAVGRFRVRPSAGMDLIFAGSPQRRPTLHSAGLPPTGQFFRMIDGRLVPIGEAAAPAHRRPLQVPNPASTTPQPPDTGDLAAQRHARLQDLRRIQNR